MGRMSAYVLVGLPFFLALMFTALNPQYMAPLSARRRATSSSAPGS